MRWPEELENYLIANQHLSNKEIAELLNRKFGTTFSADNVRNKRNRLKVREDISIEDELEHDAKKIIELTEKRDTGAKYKHALSRIDDLEKEIEALKTIRKPIETYSIEPANSSGSEATAFLIASDWHTEEIVEGRSISYLNEYNENIAKKRADNFFRNGTRLVNIFRNYGNIKTIVLALLGDFITGNIHEENVETARLQPTFAILEVKTMLISGIYHILQNTDCDIILVCSSGNHARITKDRRHATEAGHSLEYVMYEWIADHFRAEKRVKVMNSDSYHTYLNVYGDSIRFHHGHDLKYNGGVGGIYIPVNKAIAQWNKAKKADLDVFGHWHQQRDGGNFISNGSLIGYNAYALSIKADYEAPKQTFFLWDKKRKKSVVAPIDL